MKSVCGCGWSVEALGSKPRILFVCDTPKSVERLLGPLADLCDVVVVENTMRAFALLTRKKFDGVYVTADHLQQALEVGKFLQNEQILEEMPDGVVLLDRDNSIPLGERAA